MNKDELLMKILEQEWDMFVRVKSTHPVACQSSPESFKSVRGSVFAIWTQEMLAAYSKQLETAKADGRNLLTEKYARMDNLIPPLIDNPFIDDIVKICTRWQSELKQSYPALYQSCCRGTDPTGNGSNFSIYLRGELETYGDEAVNLYYENVKNADEEKRNLTIESLQQLVQKSGYPNMDEAEKYLTRATL